MMADNLGLLIILDMQIMLASFGKKVCGVGEYLPQGRPL
jgi:hypothetical protein